MTTTFPRTALFCVRRASLVVAPIAIARAAIAVLVLALAIALTIVPIAPRAISAIPVVSGIIARAFGAVMTALGALAPAAAMVAIAPRFARAEACFGVAAIGVSAVVAVRFPIVKRTRLRIAIAVFVATSVRLPFHFPSPRSLVGSELGRESGGERVGQ